MGLDMYAFATAEKPVTEVDFCKAGEVREVHYWRKHPNLHGWMHKLYDEKGGGDPEFNGAPVVLTPEDLDRLEVVIQEDALPPTAGFFFGASDGREKDDDLAFIAKAREAIAAGYTVYYDSWW